MEALLDTVLVMKGFTNTLEYTTRENGVCSSGFVSAHIHEYSEIYGAIRRGIVTRFDLVGCRTSSDPLGMSWPLST